MSRLRARWEGRGNGYSPRLRDVVRLAACWLRGHNVPGQFCTRCGWFLP